MNRYWKTLSARRLLTAGLVIAFLQGLLAAQPPAEIYENYRDGICLVEFYQNIAAQSRIGSFTKQKTYRIGILVSADGLVMVSSDVYPLSLDIQTGSGASFFSGEPTDFKVKLADGTKYDAQFVGKDDEARVAFIKINTPPPSLKYVQFSPTTDARVGDPIYLLELLGENYDFQPIFTRREINAIISDPRKKFLVKNDEFALSAGGLVLDGEGKAIGVTIKQQFSASFNNHGSLEDFQKRYLEIAPSEWFDKLIENPPVLKRETYKGKAWLGIRMQALTPALKEYWKVPADGGVIIDDVFPESPADKGGLRSQDVILAINSDEMPINRDEDLNRFRQYILSLSADTTVMLKIFRNGKILTKSVKLTSAPPSVDIANNYQLPVLGLEVRELTLDVLYDKNLPLNTRGVYVYRVDRASPAGLGGLEIGMIITEVDGHPIKDLKSFEQLMEKALQQDTPKIMFRVLRRRVTEFVFVDNK